jgi:GT2 family glycosyltransferase
MYKFCFVVLHYKLVKETIQCVDSILNLSNHPLEIVIVDNGGNNSESYLKRYYENNAHVHILVNKKNLGFSSGNNIGYMFAKSTLNADFIILSNNDIIVEDSTLLETIKDDYLKYSFGVLGPHITNMNKELNQNPAYDVMRTPKEMKRSLYRTIVWYSIAFVLTVINLDIKFLNIRNLKPCKTNNSDCNGLEFNVGLHGCFWVFSPSFVRKYNGLDEVTFMYFEEWLLYNKLRNDNILLLYDGRIDITHIGNASTNLAKSSYSDSRRLRYLRVITAAKKVINHINNELM